MRKAIYCLKRVANRNFNRAGRWGCTTVDFPDTADRRNANFHFLARTYRGDVVFLKDAVSIRKSEIAAALAEGKLVYALALEIVVNHVRSNVYHFYKTAFEAKIPAFNGDSADLVEAGYSLLLHI